MIQISTCGGGHEFSLFLFFLIFQFHFFSTFSEKDIFKPTKKEDKKYRISKYQTNLFQEKLNKNNFFKFHSSVEFKDHFVPFFAFS